MKADDDLFMSTGMLFQDLAPEKRTDLIPYCKVFFRIQKISFFEACVYHTDEHLILIQNNFGSNEGVLIDLIINKAKQF